VILGICKMNKPKITRINTELGGKIILEFDFKKDAIEFENALKIILGDML
jgi:hypothetical protein